MSAQAAVANHLSIGPSIARDVWSAATSGSSQGQSVGRPVRCIRCARGSTSLCCVEHVGCALHAWRDRGTPTYSWTRCSAPPGQWPSVVGGGANPPWSPGTRARRLQPPLFDVQPVATGTHSYSSLNKRARATRPTPRTDSRVPRALIQAPVPPCAASGRSRRQSCHLWPVATGAHSP